MLFGNFLGVHKIAPETPLRCPCFLNKNFKPWKKVRCSYNLTLCVVRSGVAWTFTDLSIGDSCGESPPDPENPLILGLVPPDSCTLVSNVSGAALRIK